MKIKVWISVALLLVCAAVAAAQDPAQKQMSPEEKAAMEAWQKAMTPGPQHKALDAMAGTWDTKVSSWMAPGAPAMTSNGTSVNRWIMGGRYMEQRFSGSVMGQPFEGLGYTGYDNVSGKYWGTWMDNMSTGMMSSTGSSSADGKSYTFTATMNDPMTGKTTSSEERITVLDKDHHNFEMWGPGPDGKNFKMMEINYTRKK
ncbi:MAG TPA: DUF1579 domain-containing protein [Thermoanaerobaculia bacterium]|jgi:hypothetical protein|nr:DUF1579 domain-containing protein [Thermoanaerobaculia bacterium]